MGFYEDISFLLASVESGSFAAAARKLGVTASAVSRRIAALEDDLGAQLLARTTRTLRLTDDGRAFYEHCARIVDDLEAARAALARSRKRPSGTLRVDCAVSIARVLVMPKLPAFLEHNPELQVELTARDQFVDLVAEGADVAVRVGDVRSTSLIARKLGEAEIVMVAAPAYLERRGVPRHPRDLAHHHLLGFMRDGHPTPWRFADADDGAHLPRGGFHSNDIEALRTVALAGRGIVSAFDFLVAADLRARRVVRVLPTYTLARWPIHALYPPNRHLLPKVRAFLDFLAEVFSSRQ